MALCPQTTRSDTRPVELVRRRVLVEGHVQGVWFRESARRQAHALGVAGWVRNREDGTVEAELEGPAADVDALVAWFGRGPSGARVDRTEVGAVEPLGERAFVVR